MKKLCAALSVMGLIFAGCVSAPVENGEENDTTVQAQQEEESTATVAEPFCRKVCHMVCHYYHGRRVCHKQCTTRCDRF